MRTIPGLVAVSLILGTCSIAANTDNDTVNCFSRLDRAAIIGDSVTVLTTDSTVYNGVRPIVNYSSSILYMKLVADSGIEGNSVTISLERVSSISYRQAGFGQLLYPLLGFAAGAAAGGYAGATLAPEGDWLEFPEVACGLIGGVMGGLIGAMGGHEIGKHHTKEVTLHCR
jgi:hypothetical protein